ncbi:MAG: hypothetical protein A2Y24_03410 [Clostridiales bacterium GWE2_32_10]|nr:MAG: hypothetical protein A2Y24_03410 [Clostridiales bacterium GWE2_32_10]
MKKLLKVLLAVVIIGLAAYLVNENLTKNEEKVGSITKNDTVTDITKQEEKKNDVEIKLYFADGDANNLFLEKRMVSVTSNENMAKKVVEELISGPSNSISLVSPIPKDTELKDIVIKDGICYVDFNENFRTNHVGGSSLERLTLYSIVNSLTELKGIGKVQFLIEGKKQEIYKGHYEFDKPFERDESVIKQ